MKPADHQQQISDEDIFVAIQYLDPDFDDFRPSRAQRPQIAGSGKADRIFLTVFIIGLLLCFAALKYLQLF